MLRVLAIATALALAAVACGRHESPAEKTTHARENQARDVARKAGLSVPVQDFLALYATAASNTFSVTYGPPATRTSIVLLQAPPLRRVDVVAPPVTRSVFVTRQGTYECSLQDQRWSCQQSQQQEGHTRVDGMAQQPIRTAVHDAVPLLPRHGVRPEVSQVTLRQPAQRDSRRDDQQHLAGWRLR